MGFAGRTPTNSVALGPARLIVSLKTHPAREHSSKLATNPDECLKTASSPPAPTNLPLQPSEARAQTARATDECFPNPKQGRCTASGILQPSAHASAIAIRLLGELQRKEPGASQKAAASGCTHIIVDAVNPSTTGPPPAQLKGHKADQSGKLCGGSVGLQKSADIRSDCMQSGKKAAAKAKTGKQAKAGAAPCCQAPLKKLAAKKGKLAKLRRMVSDSGQLARSCHFAAARGVPLAARGVSRARPPRAAHEAESAALEGCEVTNVGSSDLQQQAGRDPCVHRTRQEPFHHDKAEKLSADEGHLAGKSLSSLQREAINLETPPPPPPPPSLGEGVSPDVSIEADLTHQLAGLHQQRPPLAAASPNAQQRRQEANKIETGKLLVTGLHKPQALAGWKADKRGIKMLPVMESLKLRQPLAKLARQGKGYPRSPPRSHKKLAAGTGDPQTAMPDALSLAGRHDKALLHNQETALLARSPQCSTGSGSSAKKRKLPRKLLLQVCLAPCPQCGCGYCMPPRDNQKLP